MLDAVAWILLVGSAGGLAFWLTVAWRVRWSMRDRPTIRAGLDLPVPSHRDADAWPKVSIIVPVHDEEDVIEAAREEFERKTEGNPYVSPIPLDQKPPVPPSVPPPGTF